MPETLLCISTASFALPSPCTFGLFNLKMGEENRNNTLAVALRGGSLT